MKKNRISMALQSVLGALIPLIVVAVTITVSFSTLTSQVVVDFVGERTTSTTTQLSDSLVQDLTPIQVKLEDFECIAKNERDRDSLDTAIRGIAVNLTHCTSFYFATKQDCFSGLEDGFYLDTSDWIPDEGWIPQQRDWYKDAVKNDGAIAVSEPYVDSMTNELCVTFSKAIHDNNHELLGVVSADLILNELCNVVEKVHASENDEVHLITDNGLYLTNNDSSKIMEANYLDETKVFDGGVSRNEYLSGETKNFIVNNRYYAVQKLKGLPWFAVVEGPISDFTGYYQKRIFYIFILIITLGIISSIFIFVFTRKTTSAFRKLSSSCTRLAEGDFTEEFVSYHIKEASELSMGFKNFSDGMKNLVKKISDASNVVSNSSEELSGTAENIGHSVDLTKSSIEGMNQAVQNQISAMNSVYQNVNSVVQKVNNLADEVKGQNDMIISSSSNIGDMMEKFMAITREMETVSDKVEQLVGLSLDNKKELEDSVKLIKVVQAESGSLLEMNKVISSVASQTNLLSMNAAIEAAHAGSVGAGFSVVAEEIRKLAETTSKQAKDSTASLKSIQSKINNITDSSTKVEESFGEIIGKIENISEVVTTLTGSVTEQGKKANSVLSSLSNMKNSSEKAAEDAVKIIQSTQDSLDSCAEMKERSKEVEENIKVCSESISNLKNAENQVVENSNETQKSVEELSEAIGKFKVN
ncbi:MAG: methyl-accepting chemotaxis protein [Treponema sp.]|nr:methyl-accepting chemotaxis protein [Candidatus Treponema equifaecale]